MSIIDQEMHKRGYDMGLVGSRYVRAGVQMIAGRPELDRVMMTKELYPAIAKSANTSWQAVERAMRSAVRKVRPGGKVATELYEMAVVVRTYED